MSKLYQIYGIHVIDQLRQPQPLDKTIKQAYEYALSWTHRNPTAPVMMRVHTEVDPIEYSFGCYVDDGKSCVIDPEKDEVNDGGCNWHEICRIKQVT